MTRNLIFNDLIATVHTEPSVNRTYSRVYSILKFIFRKYSSNFSLYSSLLTEMIHAVSPLHVDRKDLLTIKLWLWKNPLKISACWSYCTCTTKGMMHLCSYQHKIGCWNGGACSGAPFAVRMFSRDVEMKGSRPMTLCTTRAQLVLPL